MKVERTPGKWRMTITVDAYDNGFLNINGGPMNATTLLQSWLGMQRCMAQMTEQFMQDQVAPALADHVNRGGLQFGLSETGDEIVVTVPGSEIGSDRQ